MLLDLNMLQTGRVHMSSLTVKTKRIISKTGRLFALAKNVRRLWLEMWQSFLLKKSCFQELHPETLIFCGHRYVLASCKASQRLYKIMQWAPNLSRRSGLSRRCYLVQTHLWCFLIENSLYSFVTPAKGHGAFDIKAGHKKLLNSFLLRNRQSMDIYSIFIG